MTGIRNRGRWPALPGFGPCPTDRRAIGSQPATLVTLQDFTRAPNDQIWIASEGSCGSRVSSACATTRTRRRTGAEIRAD